ncbi:1 domain-containing [Micractinium conductrix]|uniref:1 domain-containing n=1 Tax=Micractinium conductrix TaxID=554055 RepID=A0A2P6V762_9CHLO|nr:1 domain-containing [Micractinium conductrix]|eukprot:PSC69926.1 1 domain-containing [Micractinium conductrix]
MLGILSSQLAFSAATTLAKKTFEFSITSSLKGLSDVIRERFSNSAVLQETQGELEMKVKMLCLPVDILAHYATRGNTALQEPLGVALGVLEEVEAFRQALVAHDVARAQDAASPDAAVASAAQLTRRLRDLITRLDTLLPYLGLAISTAVLLNQGSPSPVSSSRLMAASWHLRSAPQPGAAVFSLPEAAWHEERRLTAAGPAMSELFRRCGLTVVRCCGGDAEGCSGGGGVAGGSGVSGDAVAGGWPGRFSYELLVQQDLDDGLYHEPGEEAAGELRLQISDIVALEWETTQSLQQGDNEYAPALVLHVWQGGGGAAEPPPPLQQHDSPAVAGSAAAAAEGQPGTPAAGASASRPTSRASSRRGGGTAGQADTSPAVQQTPGAATPPGAVRPSAGGLGGCVRRCAVMCNMRTPGDSDADSASDDDDEECTPGSDAGSGAGSVRSADGHGGRQLGGGAAPAAGSAVLQREWELLGELEYVLRLCMLEGREQAPHQEVTDDKIWLAFEAASVPPAAGAALAGGPAPVPPSGHRGGGTAAAQLAAADGGLAGRSSTAAAARWRSAAAGAAHALSAGEDAMTAGVRQLSFTPPAAGAAAAGAAADSGDPAGSGRQTRSRRGGGRGFGSPVQ